MAISQVALVKNSNGTNRNNLSLTPDAATVVGDLHVVVMTGFSNSLTLSAPAGDGWTAIGATNGGVAAWYRFAQAGDTSFTFTSSGVTVLSAAMLTLRGVDPTTPIGASTSNSGSGTSITLLGVVTTLPNSWLLAVTRSNGNRSYTAGSGQTELLDAFGESTGGSSIGFYSLIQAAAGASGVKSITPNASSVFDNRHFVVNPVAAVTSTRAVSSSAAVQTVETRSVGAAVAISMQTRARVYWAALTIPEGASTSPTRSLSASAALSTIGNTRSLLVSASIDTTVTSTRSIAASIAVEDSRLILYRAEMSFPDAGGTFSRLLSSSIAVSVASSRALPADVAVSTTEQRSVETHVAVKTTSTRTLAASVAVQESAVRSLSASAALSATITRIVEAQAAIQTSETRTLGASASLVTNPTRTLSATVALTTSETRFVGAAAAILVRSTRTVAAAAAILVATTREVTAQAAITATSARSIAASAAISAGMQRALSASVAVQTTSQRSVAADIAVSEARTRTLDAQIAVEATETRTVTTSVAVSVTLLAAQRFGGLMRTQPAEPLALSRVSGGGDLSATRTSTADPLSASRTHGNDDVLAASRQASTEPIALSRQASTEPLALSRTSTADPFSATRSEVDL